MAKIYNLLKILNEGEGVKFTFNGSILKSPEHELLICNRKTPSKRKPSQFILYIDDDKKRTYLSSLYRRKNDEYKLDYKGKEYILKLDYSLGEALLKGVGL